MRLRPCRARAHQSEYFCLTYFQLNKILRQELLLLENSLREFNLDTGTYPDDLNGLLSDPGIAGWNGPYADSLPDDCFYRKTAEGFELRRQ